MEGYGAVFESNVSEQKKGIVTAEKGTLEYWQQVTKAQPDKSKPGNARAVIEKIEEKAKAGVPQRILEIIETALTLAKDET
jgi:hypothetical protein